MFFPLPRFEQIETTIQPTGLDEGRDAAMRREEAVQLGAGEPHLFRDRRGPEILRPKCWSINRMVSSQ